ncbi:MAG: T9SS type A sorting domain-containing protein [Flavobacteriales bacterium]|nr:T9SS type A sorting domain-containing protein [Flavobacteriales bacterium]
MRKLTFLLVLASTAAQAQNWALLNPAYRYNYSNDGTDTISNQIRVMQVDTLGPDSFRYELNRIGVVCDTCPASLGGPCDGCYVRVNQPQFLGFECIVAGGDWLFLATDTFLIRSDASVGATWSFNTGTGITATVDAEWSDSTFTIPDTLRRILLSSGDTLIISSSFGIIRFEQGGDRVDLLGVEGAGVGRLFPKPLAYFDYQPGDQLVYHLSSIYYVYPQGGFPYYWSYDHFWQVVIKGRSGSTDSVEYTSSIARTYPLTQNSITLSEACNFQMPLNSWSFTANNVVEDHAILAAYPGQLLESSTCFPSFYETGYIVRHGITPSGASLMKAQVIAPSFGAPGGGVEMSQPVGPDLFPSSTNEMNILYEEGVGLRHVRFIPSTSVAELIVELVGAIIGGDTIIPPPVINWQVGLPEEQFSDITISPNPAADAFTVSGITKGRVLAIHDLEGRLVRNARITSANETISVQDLQPGSYLLRIDGHRPHRFIIAR